MQSFFLLRHLESSSHRHATTALFGLCFDHGDIVPTIFLPASHPGPYLHYYTRNTPPPASPPIHSFASHLTNRPQPPPSDCSAGLALTWFYFWPAASACFPISVISSGVTAVCVCAWEVHAMWCGYMRHQTHNSYAATGAQPKLTNHTKTHGCGRRPRLSGPCPRST